MLGRSEFGIEIVLAIAYQVYVVGLSFDKVCLLLNFFQNLRLRKSQADALLHQLSRHWEGEFERLCTLLANSVVVHTDETSWSIHSVWAFLSEKVRVLFFGVHKDAKTLQRSSIRRRSRGSSSATTRPCMRTSRTRRNAGPICCGRRSS